MRPWDNFFWWVEVSDLPPKTIVDPQNWPPAVGHRAAETTASVNANNGIHVKTGRRSGHDLAIARGGGLQAPDHGQRERPRPVKLASDLEPSLSVLLEDVRTRVARLHPFWAKVETPGGRVNVAGR